VKIAIDAMRAWQGRLLRKACHADNRRRSHAWPCHQGNGPRSASGYTTTQQYRNFKRQWLWLIRSVSAR
jgi:hypothetical protein